MLARVANNLFWMGRYIERSEHLARFLSVNYFSSLDAPDELSQSRQFVLRSIMYMSANEIIDSDIKSLIQSTLLHDEVYAIIMLGINIERGLQVSRIINSKVSDASAVQEIYGDVVDGSYQWSTLLKCVLSYDMMRRNYKKTPSRTNTLDFLILNSKCPRSIKNNLNQMNKYIGMISTQKEVAINSAAFIIGKMNSQLEYKLIEEIDSNLEIFIADLIEKLAQIAEKLEEDYFDISHTLTVVKDKAS